MKLKIKSAVVVPEGIPACYNPVTNEILYDKRLDDFPTLKNFILKHERQHAKLKWNWMGHLWIDARDYFKMSFKKEYYVYECKDWEELCVRNKVGEIFYQIFVLLYGAVITLIRILPMLYFKLKKTGVKK